MGAREFRGIFTDKHDGLAPLSGGGTANFLRADGGWTAPAGTYAHPNHTGDVTSIGDGATTLATVNANVGSFGLAASVAQFTVNAKGLITAAANVAIAIAAAAITDATVAGRNMLTAATVAAQTALLDVATAALKGLMSAADKTKLDAITGTNTGDQTITLTGDVTGSGTGSFAATVANDAVTLAKMANMATASFLGRNTAATGDPEVLSIATAQTMLLLESDTYTPTLTNVTNLTGSTAFLCQYMRVGSAVTVSGIVNVDPTAAGATELGISLPIASNFGAVTDLGGSGANAVVAGYSVSIRGDVTNDRASVQWDAVDLVNRTLTFMFMYRII